ncbi:MAG: InlB B-repeat-containing protein [Clostridia bacterium]|nr:InlB B-repeat-containing protein [Clostridia bacterium]
MNDKANEKTQSKNNRKKIIVSISVALAVVLISLVSALCYVFVPRNPKIESSSVLDIDPETKVATCVVDNETEMFSFDGVIKVPKNNDWFLYKDIEGVDEIKTKQVELEPGDNTFYLMVENSAGKKEFYVVTIRRKPLYEVTFNTNGGSLINAQEIEEGLTVELSEIPTKKGYTFAGWFVDEDLTTEFEANSVVANDLILYAKWNVVDYSITYHLNGGTNSELNPQTYTINDEIIFAEPTKTDSLFIGWFADSDLTNPITKIETETTGNVEIWAGWYHEKCFVSFDANGGEVETNEMLVNKNEYCVLPVPTNAGHEFAGWYNGKELLTDIHGNTLRSIGENEVLNLTAHWDDTSTVTFETNGGTPVAELSFITGSDIILPANPTKYGYVFDGWFYDNGYFLEELKETTVMLNKNIILYAKWVDYTFEIKHSNKVAISVNDTLSSALFEAIAIDNAGNTFAVSVENLTGTQNAGDVIEIKFTANGLYGEIVTETIKNVKVYENIEITYNREELFIYESEQFEDFVVATDEFEEDAEIVVQIVDGEFAAGNVVTINVTATDVAGNTKQKQFTLDVLSTSQVYVSMFDEVNDLKFDYEIIETNQDFELGESYVIYDDSSKIYTDAEGKSILQFEGKGYRKVYVDNSRAIKTVEHLKAISGATLDGKIVLLDNIDLNGEEWQPIVEFKNGIFNGNGFVVSNFKITTGRQWNGFFGIISNSTIEKLGLENFVIDNEYKSGCDVGGLVGEVKSSTTIKNCYSTGSISISGDYNYFYIGGLIGEIFGSNVNITNSYATGDVEIFVTQRSAFAGGLVGYSSSTFEILNCYATGDVSAESEQSYAYAGGLVGHTSNSTKSATIKNSYATGEISAVNTDLTGSTYIGRLYASGNPEVVGCYELMGAIKINAKEDLTKYSNYTSVVESFELMSDIDLEGAEWIPINLLGGSFNGNGFVISNFKITTGRQWNGFFSSVSNSTIKNLGLESFTINYEYSKYNSAGCLVGYLSSSNIKSCYAIGDISVENTRTDYENYVGGLIGKSNSSNISNCYTMVGVSDKFTGQISTGCKPYAGGLIGYDTSSTISNCYAAGTVYSHGQEGIGGSDIYSGGLIGNASSSIIINCFATGSVTSYVSNSNARQDRTYAGGLVGYSSNVTITNCLRYENQEISASSANKTGSSSGIVATINTEGVSASLEEIWAFVKENFDDEVWNLFDDKNPTLKFEESE